LDAPIDRGLTATEAYTPSGGYASLRQTFRHTSAETLRSMAWAAVLFASTTGVVLALWSDGYRFPPFWAILVLGLIAALADGKGVALTDRTTMSVSFIPLVFAAIAFGPLGGLSVGAVSNLWDFRDSRLKWLVYALIKALTGAAAGLAAWTFFPHPSGLGQYLLISLVACLACLVAEGVLASTTGRIRGISYASQLLAFASVSFLTVPFYVPLLALLVFTDRTYSLFIALIFLVPTLAAQQLLHLYGRERESARELATVNARLRTANARFMTGLVQIYEQSDPYTANHSLVVATYAHDIAERMGLSADDCDLVHLCGLVHDIGKSKVPREIIEKPGPLTLDERRVIEMHPEWGEELVRRIEIEDHARIAPIVRHHHEWVDGQGYPDRLSGDRIPLLARIISVADAYNAMTSKRPYRDAMPSQVARLRLAQAVGTQFDTSVVAAFEAILATADEDYRTGSSSQFAFDWDGAADTDAIEPLALQAVG
jgi:putative nucleotidyltransferase with HDIG domain